MVAYQFIYNFGTLLTEVLFLLVIVPLSVHLMIAMRFNQAHEYELHKRRILTIISLSLLSFLYFVVVLIAYALILGATLTNRRFGVPQSQAKILAVMYNIDGFAGYAFIFVSQFVYCVPFTVYLAFMTFTRPHDCFQCFNRLPNKRYSIHQYTAEERNSHYEHQFGQGAVERFDELIREATRQQQRAYVPAKATIIKAKDGSRQDEVEQEYHAYKQMMAGLIKEQDLERQRQQQASIQFVPFDRREIPITDEDVYRVGGTILNGSSSSDDDFGEY